MVEEKCVDVLFLNELTVFFLVAWRQLYVPENGGTMDMLEMIQ